jgi:hypothetical protein
MTMIDALAAHAAHPERRSRMHAFGQFVGSWDLDVRWYGDDGELLHATTGEWHFGWILGGLGVQDVWIVPSQRRADPLARSLPWGDYGTSVRFFDPAIGAWRSTWIGPVRGLVIPFIARETPTGVELLANREPDIRLRWSFSDITPQSFTWRNEEARGDDGRWVLKQEFRAGRTRGRPGPTVSSGRTGRGS